MSLRYSCARAGTFSLAAIAVAACGSQSPANNSANAATLATQSAANAAGVPAVEARALPIEQGIYGSVGEGSCARASLVFFYDGANYGYVKQAEPGANGAGAYSEVNRIHRVGPPPRESDFYEYYRGYTLVWDAENADREEDILGIKAGSDGRFTSIQVSRGGASGGEMISEETYQRCAFAQLSPQMQATIRAERPQLAKTATGQADTGSHIQGFVEFPPIEKGYYAIQMSCAAAVADPYLTLMYIDEKRASAGDGSTETLRFKPLGSGRYERSYHTIDPSGKSYTDSEVIAVKSRTSFTVEYDGEHITHTHCPTAQIPRAERMEWGDLS